jgi:hypothetical protein
MPHYSLTKDEPVVLQIFTIGLSGMNYVNPADDTRMKMSGVRMRSHFIRQLTLFSASFEVYF